MERLSQSKANNINSLRFNKIMKNLTILIATMFMLAASSCTDAERTKWGGFGDTFTVTVIGCDTIVTYQSSGKVLTEQHSDGYYFNDAKTGKLIEVSGTVIIEQN